MAKQTTVWTAEDGSEHASEELATAHENCQTCADEVHAYAQANFKFKNDKRYTAKARELMRFWIHMEAFVNSPDDDPPAAETETDKPDS